MPRGALVEWQVIAGLPISVDSEPDGGGGDEDGKWDYKPVEDEGGRGEEDVISELRYDKSESTTKSAFSFMTRPNDV